MGDEFWNGPVFLIMRWLVEFLFPGRLHRLAYFLRGMLLDGVTYFLYSCSTTMNARYFWAAVIALSVYGLFFISRPRIRDVGMSGWWLLMMLVPVADIWLGVILLFRAPCLFPEPGRETGLPVATPAV